MAWFPWVLSCRAGTGRLRGGGRAAAGLWPHVRWLYRGRRVWREAGHQRLPGPSFSLVQARQVPGPHSSRLAQAWAPRHSTAQAPGAASLSTRDHTGTVGAARQGTRLPGQPDATQWQGADRSEPARRRRRCLLAGHPGPHSAARAARIHRPPRPWPAYIARRARSPRTAPRLAVGRFPFLRPPPPPPTPPSFHSLIPVLPRPRRPSATAPAPRSSPPAGRRPVRRRSPPSSGRPPPPRPRP